MLQRATNDSWFLIRKHYSFWLGLFSVSLFLHISLRVSANHPEWLSDHEDMQKSISLVLNLWDGILAMVEAFLVVTLAPRWILQARNEAVPPSYLQHLANAAWPLTVHSMRYFTQLISRGLLGILALTISLAVQSALGGAKLWPPSAWLEHGLANILGLGIIGLGCLPFAILYLRLSFWMFAVLYPLNTAPENGSQSDLTSADPLRVSAAISQGHLGKLVAVNALGLVQIAIGLWALQFEAPGYYLAELVSLLVILITHVFMTSFLFSLYWPNRELGNKSSVETTTTP